MEICFYSFSESFYFNFLAHTWNCVCLKMHTHEIHHLRYQFYCFYTILIQWFAYRIWFSSIKFHEKSVFSTHERISSIVINILTINKKITCWYIPDRSSFSSFFATLTAARGRDHTTFPNSILYTIEAVEYMSMCKTPSSFGNSLRF